MSGGRRLAKPFGVLVDEDHPVPFTWQGLRLTGRRGDTIASALLANGVSVLSRSFKYHRPRGVFSMAGNDANTLVQLPGRPNVWADLHPLSDGLVVRAQNYRGSLMHDTGNWVEAIARFLPVGFYYKAFYKPAGAWDFWERRFRKRAGLGKIDPKAEHRYHDKQYLFADVVVVGGGPAGMAAARAAAASGAEVLLVEAMPRLGGWLLCSGEAEAAATAAAEIGSTEGIRVLTDATCTGWFADHYLAVVQDRRLYKVRAGATVIATGAIEQPMVFRNNDLPGVMLGSAARRLIHLYGVRPGSRAVVATANGEGYAVALDLLSAGVEVEAVLDLREVPDGDDRAAAVAQAGVRILPGHAPSEARPRPGKLGIKGVAVGRSGEGSAASVPTMTLKCDLLCLSAGFTPAAALLGHAGATLHYDDDLAMFEAGDLPDGLFAAGAVAGVFAPDGVQSSGRLAGWQAAVHAGFKKGRKPPAVRDKGAAGLNHPYPYFPHPDGRDFVDFDEDLQVNDLLHGVEDGFDDIQLLKRYSTLGMGPSQGRHSQLAAARIVGRATGRHPGAVGVTTSRPPVMPESMGVLAGRGFEPERLTAMHYRHVEAGAQMMPAGLWWRPAYYGPPSKSAAAIRDEVLAVRRGVGLIDVSTLGGLEVRGPDAAEFLERVYTFAYRRQPVGRSRYVLMCDETGAIVDDGVACRLGDRHFYVTATTGGADTVYRQMLWWNAQWRLDVDITNVTAAYCGINIAGPLSRKVLGEIVRDVDLSHDAFPYLAVREGTVAGIPCRMLRVGFVGELGYELHAPASQGEALWDALRLYGTGEGIRPVGVEAQRILRLEKGHIIVGQDTDALTIPQEADMAWAIARNKPFFVGGRAIEIQAARPLGRKLAGFTLSDPRAPMPEESHLTLDDEGEITGRVTSVARSPTLERVIGLAMVSPDQAQLGARFAIKTAPNHFVEAKTVRLPFYDRNNRRQEV